MTHAGHAWAPTGTPGRCLEGVTPGSAGIFSALSYFVAETPIIFISFSVCVKLVPLLDCGASEPKRPRKLKLMTFQNQERSKNVGLEIKKKYLKLSKILPTSATQ